MVMMELTAQAVPRVLVVSGDGPRRREIVESLRARGFDAWGSSSAAFARSTAKRRGPRLAILAMADDEASALAAQLREDGHQAPIWCWNGSLGSPRVRELSAEQLAERVQTLLGAPSGSAPERPAPPRLEPRVEPPDVAQDEQSEVVTQRRRRQRLGFRPRVLAIGISTGGPNALAQLVPRLPAWLPVPVLIVQHMPAQFTALLAERLDANSPLHVREGIDGAELVAGDVWIAPGGLHMVVEGDRSHPVLRLTEDPPENGCRPAVDPLFRSVAEVYGGHALGVIMTGMGKDGTAGAAPLAEAGAMLLAQDQQSSVVWGMPGALVAAGLADEVHPLSELADAIVRHLGARR